MKISYFFRFAFTLNKEIKDIAKIIVKIGKGTLVWGSSGWSSIGFVFVVMSKR